MNKDLTSVKITIMKANLNAFSTGYMTLMLLLPMLEATSACYLARVCSGHTSFSVDGWRICIVGKVSNEEVESCNTPGQLGQE